MSSERTIDNFMPIFKHFKNNFEENDFKQNKQIIDFSNIDPNDNRIREVCVRRNQSIESPIASDFRDPSQWKVFTVFGLEGLLVIPAVLTKQSSQKWFHYLLEELPFTDKDRLKANISLPPVGAADESNLRWISLGYHYDWDSKVYSEADRSDIPEVIAHLSHYMSRSLGFDSFEGEAGLINYYRHKSTLCPHSDHSEPNKTAPLFSLSLGSSAIFLIGSTTKCSSQPISALRLRDGDLLVMSEQCRQSYHAIPKILSDRSRVGRVRRINLNLRQVNWKLLLLLKGLTIW